MASRDRIGRVWPSPLVGGVGFARALEDRRALLTVSLTLGECDLDGAGLDHLRDHSMLASGFAARSRRRDGAGAAAAIAVAARLSASRDAFGDGRGSHPRVNQRMSALP
ncbi:MAG: hypothetical protein ACTHQQ_06025 [Solirubrobacteraceae bacterium]